MIKLRHVQLVATLFLAAVILSACQTAGRVSEKDIITSADMYKGPEGTIKRFNESRVIDGSFDAVFRSILDALQNKGFYIDEVDSKAGFIRANTPDALLGTKGMDKYLPPLPRLTLGVSWNIMAGLIRQIAIFTVEAQGDKQTRVRISLLRYLYGMGPRQGMGGHYPEFDQELMNELFSELGKEMMTRRIMKKS